MNNKRLTPLQIIIHIGSIAPLLWLAAQYFTGNLGVNPIQEIEQRTGRLAITWLMFTLACTPLKNILGWKELNIRRRALGLYTFMYAAIHLLIFLSIDYRFNWNLIKIELVEKNYIIVGVIAFFLLSLLALTSSHYWINKLKKNWKKLHRFIYLIAPLTVIHYALVKKGNLLRLQGDIIKPLIYGIIVLLLLTLRLPPVRKAIISIRNNISKKTSKGIDKTTRKAV